MGSLTLAPHSKDICFSKAARVVSKNYALKFHSFVVILILPSLFTRTVETTSKSCHTSFTTVDTVAAVEAEVSTTQEPCRTDLVTKDESIAALIASYGNNIPIDATKVLVKAEQDYSCIPQRDLSIEQGMLGTLPNGIPVFSVTIINTCGKSVRGIHIACGSFSSATLINPKIFSRLHYNDCLLKNGDWIRSMESVLFQYSSSFMYPLSVL